MHAAESELVFDWRAGLSADPDTASPSQGPDKPETCSNLLGNRIVLIAHNDKAQAIDIKPGFDLAKALADGRLSVANVDSVAAGKYGKAALEKLGVWASVSGNSAKRDAD